jgi:hypothetical protein
MTSNLAQTICTNLITRCQMYYPEFSSSVFVHKCHPFFLNIVKTEHAKRPILKLSQSTHSKLYLFSCQHNKSFLLHTETLCGAIGGNMASKIKMEKTIQKILNEAL